MKYIHIFKSYVKLALVSGVIILLSLKTIYAQQDTQFTQYMYNTSTINPAYSGTKGHLSFLGLYRSQWVGLEGAPKTASFTMDSPVGFDENVGVGLSFTQDAIGPSDESTISADYSYSLYISRFGEVKLSFGLKGGVNLLNVDYSKLNIYNPNDGLQQNNIENRLKPLVGVGVYLYDEQKWYVGLSVPNLLKTTYYDDTRVSYATKRATGYFMAGYVFDVSPSTKFKPTLLTKYTLGAPMAIDLSANFLFNEKFTLGAAYRFGASISGLAGFQVSENILLGYAYDYGTKELSSYNSGSHELFLRFDIFKDRSGRMISPRFY